MTLRSASAKRGVRLRGTRAGRRGRVRGRYRDWRPSRWRPCRRLSPGRASGRRSWGRRSAVQATASLTSRVLAEPSGCLPWRCAVSALRTGMPASKSPSICAASAPSSRSTSRVASAASDSAITAVCGFFCCTAGRQTRLAQGIVDLDEHLRQLPEAAILAEPRLRLRPGVGRDDACDRFAGLLARQRQDRTVPGVACVRRQLLWPVVSPHLRMLPACLKRIVPMVFRLERRVARP